MRRIFIAIDALKKTCRGCRYKAVYVTDVVKCTNVGFEIEYEFQRIIKDDKRLDVCLAADIGEEIK